MYRSESFHEDCRVCAAPTEGARCLRCDAPLCSAHVPASDQFRCGPCERAWGDPPVSLAGGAGELVSYSLSAPRGDLAGVVIGVVLVAGFAAVKLAFPWSLALIPAGVGIALARRRAERRRLRRIFLAERPGGRLAGAP